MIRFIVKSLIVMFLLPALGLIVFHGGFLYALLTALVLGLVGFGVRLVLFPFLVTGGLAALFAGGALAGQLGARLVMFTIETILFALTLWLATHMMSGIALVGFWPTIGAAAILAFASSIFTRHSSN